MKPRPDNALEVWLEKSNRGLGWLPQDSYKVLGKHVIEVTITTTVDGEEIDDTRMFNLVDRHQVVANERLQDVRRRADALIVFGIPLYAIENRVPVSDHTKFSWMTLSLSADDHEWLFDHPGFEPLDTEADKEILREERTKRLNAEMAETINDMLHNTIMGNSGFLSSVTGAVSGTTSANDSTLTAEKLRDAMKLIVGR